MRPKTTKFIALSITFVWTWLLHAPCSSAFSLEINNHQISIEAQQVPLQDVLKRLAGYGIRIRIDPDINPRISATFENRDLEDGIKAILKSHNHVLFWKRSHSKQDGSTMDVFMLDEIQVFRPGQKGRMINFDPSATNDSATRPSVVSLPETKVSIQGNRVFVPVTIGYEDATVETTLIFDTGAGSIVIHDNIAEQLGINDTQAAKGIGVGGIEIESRVARLKYVQVGPHTKKDLRADIIAYQGEVDARYNGLLGMNFIRGLKYTIDFDNQVIQWLP